MAKNQNTWFDDPEWDKLREKIEKRGNSAVSESPSPSTPQPHQPQKPSTAFEEPRDDRPVQISINLSLPTMETLGPLVGRVKQLKQLRSWIATRMPGVKQVKVTGLVAGVIILGVVGYVATKGLLHSKDKSDVLATKVEKPTFAVATPEGGVKPQDQVVFDSSKQVASYRDQINGVNVIVSQQQLPESFKSDPFGHLEELAKSFSANDSFAVKDFKVYIGTSIKGPQSLIMIKGKLLIFLRSDSKISNSDWVNYIETLKVD